MKKIAVIMRSDEVIKEFNLKRVTVNTSYGPVDRCFEGVIYGVYVLIIYGRFNGQKVPSENINFEQTIEVVKNKKIDKLIGTFVVGGINPDKPQGTVYVVTDLVGMSGYSIRWDQNESFHNAEMYNPFCKSLTYELQRVASKMDFNVETEARYVSFFGWPRIETKAELEFYNKMGWDIVGQTCDPEATCARLSGICYAAVAVQIDDPSSREEHIRTAENELEEKKYVESISSCRKRTTALVLQFLKDYSMDECSVCKKMVRKNKDFREFPRWYYE